MVNFLSHMNPSDSLGFNKVFILIFRNQILIMSLAVKHSLVTL